jgi:hypothetical protein
MCKTIIDAGIIMFIIIRLGQHAVVREYSQMCITICTCMFIIIICFVLYGTSIILPSHGFLSHV